jgi:polar amino acid transport system substrate-binding protein
LLLLAGGACSNVRRAASGDFQPSTKGALVVATELPAPGFWDGNDPATVNGGFEWALADALAHELDVKLVIHNVAFADIAAGKLGDADLALAQISATDQRRDVAQLTVPYGETSPAAVARPGTEEDLDDLATAQDKRWVVQGATTLESFLDDVVRPDADPLLVPTTDDVVSAVRDGRADVGLLDLPTALSVAAGGEVSVPARFDREESIVGMLPKGSDNFDAIDSALRRLIADGTVANLRNRWLDADFTIDPDDIDVIRTHS